MGAAKVADALPPLLEAVRARRPQGAVGAAIRCTATPRAPRTASRRAASRTSARELDQAFDIHAAPGTRLGGVHLELTGEDVTECMGGARDLTEVDLERAYRSQVDPRLNYEQALELAMRIVRKQSAWRSRRKPDAGFTGMVAAGNCGGLRACVACSNAYPKPSSSPRSRRGP